MNAYPLLIEFVSDTRITREPEVMSKLPILQNGPPGTSVVFRDGAEVPLRAARLRAASAIAGRIGTVGRRVRGLAVAAGDDHRLADGALKVAVDPDGLDHRVTRGALFATGHRAGV